MVSVGFSTSSYPETRRDDVAEEIHGVLVADPYRWLEEVQRPEVREWTAAQNACTREALDALEQRDRIQARLLALAALDYTSPPQARRGRYFYQRRSGKQNQAVLLVREGLNGPERALVDPNELSEEGLVSLDWWVASPDGALLAYGLSEGGDEWSTLYVLDTITGGDLGEAIPWTRYCSLAWLPDNSGFYYTRYPLPGTVPPEQEDYNAHLYFH